MVELGEAVESRYSHPTKHQAIYGPPRVQHY
jgi:hypothetical protein